MDAVDEGHIYGKKGKGKTYLPRSEILELKLRTGRQGKCVGAAKEFFIITENKPQEPQTYTLISNDIWLHIANYIPPEDVKNYALICTQSANSINCRLFWLQMYRRYCQKTTGRSIKWILDLPEKLQMYRLRECDRNILRQRVIQALYRCYPPFQKRLRQVNACSLDPLKGRIYVSSWRKLMNSKEIMCYKFQHDFSSSFANKKSTVSSRTTNDNKVGISDAIADNWECLIDKTTNNYCKEKQSYSTSSTNSLEGIFLLCIYSERFSPLPIICDHDTGPLHLTSSRLLLSSDMKSQDLELNFISSTNAQSSIVKLLNVQVLEVVPWWHPCFEEFLQCE